MSPLRPTDGPGNRLIIQGRQIQKQQQSAMERLATGRRILRGRDDPAGMITAAQLQAELTTLEAEQRSAAATSRQEAITGLATQHTSAMLQHMHGLIGAAADGTLTNEQRHALQIEIDQSIDSIDRIQSYTAKYASAESDWQPQDWSRLRSGGDRNVINGDIAAAQAMVRDRLTESVHRQAKDGAAARTREKMSELRDDQIINQQQALSEVRDLDFVTGVRDLHRARILAESHLLVMQQHFATQKSSMGSLLAGIDWTI